MKILHPQDITTAFAQAYNSGDVENLLALYGDDAVLAIAPGKRAHGIAEIRAALSESLAFGGRMDAVNHYCLQSGDVALVQGEWTLRAEKDGVLMTLTSRTAEVVRRQSDGSWRYVCDHAFANDDAEVVPQVDSLPGRMA